MTNLEYLLSKMNVDESADLEAQQEAQLLSYKFSRLIELVFHVENGLKCSQCGEHISYGEYIQKLAQVSSDAIDPETQQKQGVKCQCGSQDWKPLIRYEKDDAPKPKPVLIIDDHRITSDDFDLFRQVVMYQNLPDYFDDSWIDPDIKADHAAKMELKAKQNPVTTTTELKMLAVVASTSYKLDEVYNLTIRKFISLLAMIDDKINYTATRVGMMTGMVSLKEAPEHWLYKKETDVYGDAYKTMDQVSSDMSKLG